jgi:hypothetical protein
MGISKDIEWHRRNISQITKQSINKKASFRCPICGKSFRYKNSLKHYLSHLKNSSDEKLNGLYFEINHEITSQLSNRNQFEPGPKEKLTKEEQQALSLRVQTRGFGEGAHIPHSNITKYGKNQKRK